MSPLETKRLRELQMWSHSHVTIYGLLGTRIKEDASFKVAEKGENLFNTGKPREKLQGTVLVIE